MPKFATPTLTQIDLEQLYAEIENRVERKFEARFRAQAKEIDRLKEDCAAWQNRYFKEQETSRKLAEEVKFARKEIAALKDTIEKQCSRIAGLEKQLHGKSTEVSKPADEPDQEKTPKRAKGKQPGAKGHGRKQRPNLPPKDCVHDFAPDARMCKSCGAPYSAMGEVVSEEIDVEYKLIRLIHKRKKIIRSCQCPGTPKIKVAPAPPKLFKGGLFTTDFWAYAIFDKYQLQRPTNRTRELWAAHGLLVSQGTITNGLKRLHTSGVFKPLVDEIRERVKASPRQKSDETGWKVFQEMEGKKGYQHWLWATLCEDACLYRIDPHRSKEVALRMIGPQPIVLTTDRLPVYRNLGENVTNSWCWAHIRREFLALLNSNLTKALGQRWVEKVDKLYHLNNLRLANYGANFDRYDTELRQEIAEFERQLKSNSKRPGMKPAVRKLFKNIARDWKGLTVFVELPEIPMDNNESERALRNAACGRNAYYGSGALWAADFTADMFTIFTTLKMNGMNQIQWLRDYLRAVALCGGKTPPNATSFLPWNTPPVEFLST